MMEGIISCFGVKGEKDKAKNIDLYLKMAIDDIKKERFNWEEMKEAIWEVGKEKTNFPPVYGDFKSKASIFATKRRHKTVDNSSDNYTCKFDLCDGSRVLMRIDDMGVERAGLCRCHSKCQDSHCTEYLRNKYGKQEIHEKKPISKEQRDNFFKEFKRVLGRNVPKEEDYLGFNLDPLRRDRYA